MRRTKREIMAGVECVSSKIIDHNTVEYMRINGERVIRLHLTDIITFKSNGDIVLDSGGWQTVTAKERMNKFLPDWYITQSKNVWYLAKGFLQDREEYVYQDGITILGTGGVKGAGEDRKKLDKRLKQIKVYVDGFMKKLVARKLPQPGNGDCWYCSMKTVGDGRSLGDSLNDNDHILEHFKEKYYVPSLLMNAMEEFGVSQMDKHCVGYWLKYYDDRIESVEDWAWKNIRKVLTRYLKRRLGMAA